jgi:5-methylcytosine-specific restriction endonuclease McrA
MDEGGMMDADEKKRLSAARYREKNREKLRQAYADYRTRKHDVILQKKRETYAANKQAAQEYARANKERLKAARRERYLRNKATILAANRAYREANKDRVRDAKRRWDQANPGVRRLSHIKRRAAKRGSSGQLSRDILSRLAKLQKNRCANCRCDLVKDNTHLDHIVPLFLGGANDDKNVQLLCGPCNLRKAAKDPIEWAQENGRLL